MLYRIAALAAFLVSADALKIGAGMSRRAFAAKAASGAALLIDYGRARPEAGDTLQALRRHQKVDPLDSPGEADLTQWADFPRVLEAAGCLWSLAINDCNKVAIVAAEPLCTLLFQGTPLSAANAHGALQNLTFHVEARRRVADAFGRPDLADDATTLRRKLQASVTPPSSAKPKGWESALRGLPGCLGDTAC